MKRQYALLLVAMFASAIGTTAQTAFVNFDAAGQYTGNFSQWQDAGGTDGGNYAFSQSATAGVAGGGGVSVFQSTDMTATYKNGSWVFSTNGAALILSVLIKANGQTSGNKVQFGIQNTSTNGLNSNPGVSFESYRFIPTSSNVWSLREQFRTNNVTGPDLVLGDVTVIPGHWYKFVVGLTNTSGPSGNYNSGCALYYYGPDGTTPGTNAVTFSTTLTHTAHGIAQVPAVWPALRAFQDAGIDSWDNFLVYTTNSGPTITLPLTNIATVPGFPVTVGILAEGPGSISYSWYTNHTLVSGASGPTYTTPPLNSSYTNLIVIASNAKGSATNQIAISTVTQVMTPVAVTGFNRDVVVENNAAGPPFTGAAMEFNAGEGTAFYQNGLPGKSYGLPASGSFVSAVGDSTTFQFQPYTGNNALVLSSQTGLTSGSLSLMTPTQFSRIGIIAHSGSGGGTPNVTLHFNDGSSFTTTYNAQDWFFNPGFALQGVDRINLTTGATSGGPNDPRFYQTTLPLGSLLGASNRPLVSLTFNKAAGANATAIYAISGLPSAAISLPTVTNSPATGIQAKAATLAGRVIDSGGEAPVVTIFFGPSNGGTNAAAWAQSISLGVQGGLFTRTVTGLVQNTTYYFTSRAVNSAGTVWATPSLMFTTLTATLPTMVNLPAGSVGPNSATIGGQVTANGNDPPTITLYYGPTDGGTDPAAWAQAVGVGVQSGNFDYTVFGLSPASTYYFTAKGVNSAGTVWAAPSSVFTTLPDSPTPVAVLSQHNDRAGTGANLQESILNVANVNSNQFGLLYTRLVDDQIYAQPLIVTNVSIPGKGVHNVVYVCTLNDSVYAFDADDPTVTNAYWQLGFVGLLNGTNSVAPRNTDMTGACGGNYRDFSGNIGIVSTPVIDPVSGTIYLVARTKEMTATTTNFVQRLHALDIRTGAQRSNSPVVITATYPGTGAGNVGGIITFDPLRQNQRSALTLVNGVVYIGWASHCDWGPYHGWLMGYDSTNLQRVVTYMTTRNGSNGGIWMSGAPPASDENGNLYLSTGNGSVGISGNRADLNNRGESFLKLTRSGTNMTISSWFTPYNWATLEAGDIDLGSAGILLIPGTTLAFSGGKEGKVYLVDRDNMGGLSGSTSDDTNVVQSWQLTGLSNPNDIHGGPVWWDGPAGSYAYIWGEFHYLRQYRFNWAAGKFYLPEYAQSTVQAPQGMPGGILSISAYGTNAGTGILWASHQFSGDANQQVRPGVLRAFNAESVTNQLWHSEQVSSRDSVGNFAKYVPPTVANGKVYLATFSNRLHVYGLLPRPSLSIALAGNNAILTWPTNGFFSYKLQSTAGLAPSNWQDATNTVVVSNGMFRVTTPASSAPTFYRLVK